MSSSTPTESVANVSVHVEQTGLLESNTTAAMRCSASSGSLLSFLWTNGSAKLTAGERVRLTDGGSALAIGNVSRYDRGPFRCRVFNRVSNGTSEPVYLTISCEYLWKLQIMAHAHCESWIITTGCWQCGSKLIWSVEKLQQKTSHGPKKHFYYGLQYKHKGLTGWLRPETRLRANLSIVDLSVLVL